MSEIIMSIMVHSSTGALQIDPCKKNVVSIDRWYTVSGKDITIASTYGVWHKY